jgi:CHASE3 domain sensor protein
MSQESSWLDLYERFHENTDRLAIDIDRLADDLRTSKTQIGTVRSSLEDLRVLAAQMQKDICSTAVAWKNAESVAAVAGDAAGKAISLSVDGTSQEMIKQLKEMTDRAAVATKAYDASVARVGVWVTFSVVLALLVGAAAAIGTYKITTASPLNLQQIRLMNEGAIFERMFALASKKDAGTLSALYARATKNN